MSRNPGKKRAISARPAACVSDEDYRKAFAKWVASLTPAEERQDLLVIGNRRYTPSQVLQEINKGSTVGKAFAQSLRKLRVLRVS